MRRSALAAGLAALLLAAAPARADNPMGYRLLSEQEARNLPRNHGKVGMEVDRAERITDAGMAFDVMRVKDVTRGSPAARAGLAQGDQIIAVDGLVFPTIAAFAAYLGSTKPGSQITVDYMPRNGGPQQAQRLTLTVGGEGHEGMSTGTKVAIGVGAAALFGCYEMGCFSHHANGQ